MNLPSVTCVMPCGYGSRYVQLALDCFRSQTYEGPMELIVLDNNVVGNTIEFLMPHLDDRIKYVKCSPMPIGALRNLGNSYGTGEVIINWDEDDWSSPDRVAAQVERLRASGKPVTGWHNLLYYETETGQCFKYQFERPGVNHPPYACGASQAYLRTWWEKHPYEPKGIEDFPFQKYAREARQLDSTDAGQLYVARAHKDSKCPVGQYKNQRQFPPAKREQLPPKFFADLTGERVSEPAALATKE